MRRRKRTLIHFPYRWSRVTIILSARSCFSCQVKRLVWWVLTEQWSPSINSISMPACRDKWMNAFRYFNTFPSLRMKIFPSAGLFFRRKLRREKQKNWKKISFLNIWMLDNIRHTISMKCWLEHWFLWCALSW